MRQWILAVAVVALASMTSPAFAEDEATGAIDACQTHVERLLKSAAQTDFADRALTRSGDDKIEIFEKVRTVDTSGKERTGRYTCLATRYTPKLWGTKTSLALTK